MKQKTTTPVKLPKNSYKGGCESKAKFKKKAHGGMVKNYKKGGKVC